MSNAPEKKKHDASCGLRFDICYLLIHSCGFPSSLVSVIGARYFQT